MVAQLKSLTRGLAEIYALANPWQGMALLAIVMINPRIALFGVIATLAAYGAARLVGFEATFFQAGYYIYNPFLVGCSIGFSYQIAASTIVLTILAGVASLVVTLLLAQLIVG